MCFHASPDRSFPGASWDLLGPPGPSWGLLGPPGASWGLLGPPGASWDLLGRPGASWGLQGPPGASFFLAMPVSCLWTLPISRASYAVGREAEARTKSLQFFAKLLELVVCLLKPLLPLGIRCHSIDIHLAMLRILLDGEVCRGAICKME